MSSRKSLGRNLNALLGSSTAVKPKPQTASPSTPPKQAPIVEKKPQTIAVEFLQPGKYQPRTIMEDAALEELASSIKAQGIIQPIVVRPIGNNKYEILAGERRWRAAQRAGLHNVPIVIRETTDQQAIAISLIENIQREDLNPMEEAIALQRLIDEFVLTHQEAAEAVGKSRVGVSNLLRLLQLDVSVKTMLEHGDLEMGHARALLSLDRLQQKSIAQTVVAKGLSVRETEALVRRLQQQAGKKPSKTMRMDPNIKAFQDKLSEKIGLKVDVKHQRGGKGTLTIHYNTLDELQGACDHLLED